MPLAAADRVPAQQLADAKIHLDHSRIQIPRHRSVAVPLCDGTSFGVCFGTVLTRCCATCRPCCASTPSPVVPANQSSALFSCSPTPKCRELPAGPTGKASRKACFSAAKATAKGAGAAGAGGKGEEAEGKAKRGPPKLSAACTQTWSGLVQSFVPCGSDGNYLTVRFVLKWLASCDATAFLSLHASAVDHVLV